ncbi:MAG: hypothetical protein ACI9N9_000104 [Enterobacterales bacterium]|jgi:hypothetical protein
MPSEITGEGYKTSPSTVFQNVLQANSLERTEAYTTFNNEYFIASGVSVVFVTQGISVTRQTPSGASGGPWSDFIGFAVGSVIQMQFTHPGPILHVFTRTITYINDNVFYIDSALPAPYNAATFPNGGNISAMSISMNQAPESVEFSFNLALDGTLTENSLIDTEVNRFRADGVDLLAPAGSVAMTQIGTNRSGGQITDVVLTLNANGGAPHNITRGFTITYKFIPWVMIQEGFDEPQAFNGTDNVVPYITVTNFAKTGNPNGVQSAISAALNANTGGFDMNFNNGTNIYSLQGITWFSTSGDPIDGVDYTDDSDFVAVINAPDQTVGTSEYIFGLAWRPADGSRYKNLVPQIANNLRWNVPDMVWNHSVTPDPATYNGFSLGAARFDLTNMLFKIVGLTVVVSGRVKPIGIQALFESVTDPVPVGDRKITLAVGLGDVSLPVYSSNRVMLIINDADAIDAPVIGVQYPDVVNKVLLNHNGVDVIDPTQPNTTTEDDLLYKSQFLLTKNVEYDAVRVRIFAQNDITFDEFTIEEETFNLSDPTYGNYTAAGIHEYNKEVSRNLGLPLSSDRNLMSLKREASIDTAPKYGMELQYGFLSRWESWIAKANVNSFFFDNSLLNNGLNENWQRFTDADWQLYIAYYVRLNDVDDFDIQNIKTRPYDDDGDFTYLFEYITAGGVVLTGIAIDVLNPIMTLRVTVNYVVDFSQEWFEIRMENFQGSKIDFISTVIDSDATTSTVLIPLAGETKLKKTVVTTQTVIECSIDTSALAGNNVSLTLISDTFVAPTTPKKLTDGTLKRTTGGTFKNLA